MTFTRELPKAAFQNIFSLGNTAWEPVFPSLTRLQAINAEGCFGGRQRGAGRPRDAARNSRFPSPALRYWSAGAEGLPFSLAQDTGCAACSASGVQCKALLLLTVCLVSFQPIILGYVCVWCILVCVYVLDRCGSVEARVSSIALCLILLRKGLSLNLEILFATLAASKTQASSSFHPYLPQCWGYRNVQTGHMF